MKKIFHRRAVRSLSALYISTSGKFEKFCASSRRAPNSLSALRPQRAVRWLSSAPLGTLREVPPINCPLLLSQSTKSTLRCAPPSRGLWLAQRWRRKKKKNFFSAAARARPLLQPRTCPTRSSERRWSKSLPSGQVRTPPRKQRPSKRVRSPPSLSRALSVDDAFCRLSLTADGSYPPSAAISQEG